MKSHYLLTFIAIAIVSNALYAQDFYGYYTRTDYDDGISGKYADVIVSYGNNGRIVFSRESSYLPSWQTGKGEYYFEEIIKRRGDGSGIQPDRFNRYSYVRIIENTPDKILIQWRYYPDFLKTEMTDIVHEFFTFFPDGKVRREIKVGTEKIDEWKSSDYKYQYDYSLGDDGIHQDSYREYKYQKEKVIFDGNPIIENRIREPITYWSFDEGMIDGGNKVTEKLTNISVPVSGNKTYWIPGVSGTALKFDGYYSGIKLPVQYAPRISGEFTIEAWITMAAHPFGWVPIVHQSNWKEAGYYFGINAKGQVGFLSNIGGRWRELITDKSINNYRWTHLAVSYNDEERKLIIYIDGKSEAELKINPDIESSALIHANAPLTIGLNTDPLIPLPNERFSYGQYPCITGFEGAIDEVRFYSEELSSADISKAYLKFKPNEISTESLFDKRILPGLPGYADKFGAEYKTFSYHNLWDNCWRTSNYDDILIKFDKLPTSVTFWRGPSYGAGWVTDKNFWMLDQSVETGNAISYVEHMSDKQGRYSHVRIIENTDARVVIHWRYSANDVLYSFNENYGEAGIWVDEYLTIYPDGVGIRKVNQRALNWNEEPPDKISWQDVQFASQPGMTPDDVMNLEAVHLANLNGETAVMDWTNGVPPENPLPSANIELINFKSEYKVFLAFQEGTFINPWGHVPKNMYCHFMTWNHWPVAFITSQGKSSLFPDRITHSALCAADNAVDHGNIAMYGFTNQSVESLIPLVKSWNHPAELTHNKNCENFGYDKDQRAYLIRSFGENIEFDLESSESYPLNNPCFVIKNWNGSEKVKVMVNSEKIELGNENRQGIVRDTDGKRMLLVWLKLNSLRRNHVEIKSM